MYPKYFLNLQVNQITTNFVYLTSSNFVTISQINYWDHVNSWKNFWKFWNCPRCRNKSAPSPLLNVAAYCQSSNIEACAKKLSRVLANNIEYGGRGFVSELVWGIVEHFRKQITFLLWHVMGLLIYQITFFEVLELAHGLIYNAHNLQFLLLQLNKHWGNRGVFWKVT